MFPLFFLYFALRRSRFLPPCTAWRSMTLVSRHAGWRSAEDELFMNLPGIFFFEAGMAWWLLLCEVMLTVSCLSEQNLPPLMLSQRTWFEPQYLSRCMCPFHFCWCSGGYWVVEAQPRQWMIRKPDVSAGREQLKAEILVAEIGGLAKELGIVAIGENLYYNCDCHIV